MGVSASYFVTAVAGLILSMPSLVWAQGAPSVPVETRPLGYRAGGLSAAITNASLRGPNLNVQVVIKNNRTTAVLLSPLLVRTNEMAALSSSGVIFSPDTFIGIASCDAGGSLVSAIAQCMKEFSTSAMTNLEPNQTATLGISFRQSGTPEKEGATISFTVKFLVRTAPKEEDSLDAAAKGATPGPPSIVSINFQMVPLKIE